MAEAREADIPAGGLVQLYEANEYEQISIRTLGPNMQFGFKPTVPPAGGSDAIRLITTDDMTFTVGPGDTIYVGNNAGAAAAVQLVTSPVPWPRGILELLGTSARKGAEAFFYPAVPIGAAEEAYTATEYTSIALSVRITTPGNGQISFKRTMDMAYVVPNANDFEHFIMAPGDTLYVEGVTAPMDFNFIASPAPWWNETLWKRVSQIMERNR